MKKIAIFVLVGMFFQLSAYNPSRVLLQAGAMAAKQAYTCNKCISVSGCSAYEEAMRVASVQPRGKIGSREIVQAAGSTSLSVLSAAAIPYVVQCSSYTELITELTKGGISLLPLTIMAGLASSSAVFAWRARSCLYHANPAWWKANDLRLDISALCGNENLYQMGLSDPAKFASYISIAINEKPGLERKLVETCCQVQKDIEGMKEELQK